MANALIRSKITGTGLGVPARLVSNFDLEKIVDTTDEWIRTRTGISTRRLIDTKTQSNTSISVEAAKQALQKSGLNISQIDLIIACTATPETIMPITAARIAGDLGAHNAGAFDLNAACSGFVTGLATADAYLRSGLAKKILLIGTDVFSSITNWKDRTTCVLFGDGSGAAVLEAFESQGDPNESCIVDSVLMSEFDKNMNLAVLGGGSLYPHGAMEDKQPFITMNGGEVFKSGTRAMALAAEKILQKNNLTIDQIDWLVPHQANKRIIEMVSKLTGFPLEKTYQNVDRWGNTSAATLAICLAEMNEQKLLKKGQLILTVSFGGGYTFGANLLRW